MLPSLGSGQTFSDLTHMLPLQSDQKALDVLHEEIIKNIGGASNTAKVVEPATSFAMASLSTIGGKACEVGTSDGPTNSPCTSCASCSLGWHSQTWSWSPWHHSQSLQSSSSSSDSSSRSGSASGTSSLGSSQSVSHAASPEIVLLQDDDDDTAVGGEEDAGHSNDETLS